ncbi:stress response protein NST1 [Neltuma alba]|uniref:stress response protein NST1 n=1 Tax=Neltuma alba TaxID=207710 RepID=UPI0010A3EA87|nr:stress response protein NST1 [Prosopis alba]
MKNRSRKNEGTSESFNKSDSIDRPKSKTMKKKQKNNLPRLGAGGLSLHAFANAKSKDNHYNPALIKKQREFYKNAKKVNKFKKLLKQQNEQNDVSLPQRMIESENGVEEDRDNNKKRIRKDASLRLEELYKKKHEEKEKERLEREAAIKAKKEEIEKAESRRKAMRDKMFKKTRKGQPVMKYRIEHLLETIQDSTKH